MAELPSYIEIRHDQMARAWRFVCRACSIREEYAKFWTASRVAQAHAAMHLAEEEGPPSTSAGEPS